jgi:hypothetical protein
MQATNIQRPLDEVKERVQEEAPRLSAPLETTVFRIIAGRQ